MAARFQESPSPGGSAISGDDGSSIGASSDAASSIDEAELEAVAAVAGGPRKKKKRPEQRQPPPQPPQSCHPAAGLQAELERFLRSFADAGVARFTAFAEQFRSPAAARLQELHLGRESLESLADYLQCLHHLLVLYTQPPHATLLRIGAVYLLYAYHVKLADLVVAPIRVSLSQWQRLSELRGQLAQEGHCDALYCLGYLRLRCAFRLCAQPLPCYPGAPPALCPAAEAARTRLAGDLQPLRGLLGEERLDTLRALHAQYAVLKAPLAGAGAPALNVVDEHAVDRVEAACDAPPVAFDAGAKRKRPRPEGDEGMM